ANIDDIRYCVLDSFASVALIVPSIVEGVDLELCAIMHFKNANDQMRGCLLAQLSGRIAQSNFSILAEGSPASWGNIRSIVLLVVQLSTKLKASLGLAYTLPAEGFGRQPVRGDILVDLCRKIVDVAPVATQQFLMQ